MSGTDTPEADRRGDLPHPRETFDLIGQSSAEAAFLSALNQGRLHHAWLLQGPEGIGKATFAYRIARHILARGDRPAQALTLDAADPVSRQIIARSHPDLLVLTRPYDLKDKKLKTVITVDEVRKAGQFFAKTAARGGFRVVILDSAEDLNPAAANGLLKTLEEPPPRGLFLVVSHAPGGLLPTIRSRCRTLALRPLQGEEIDTLLRRHAPDLSDADRGLLVDLADGSVGRALSLAQDRGLALFRDLTDLLADLPKLDMARLHGFADRVVKSGDEGDHFHLTGALLSQWLVRRVRRGAAEGQGHLDRLVEVWEKIGRLFERADAVNLPRKQVILDVFFSLQHAART